MMFKITSIVALAAALMFNAEATAVDGSSKLEARQPLPCPSSTEAELRALGGTNDPWDSVYLVNATGDPIAFVKECNNGCNQQGNGVPSTTCR
ncbi:hypothetical protein C7999DRAFT_36281 [Corynascus novoguineensis]|uniref:Uncharacterized protein n=1 Tax=Corynascus novoguineensis TaxID=1126955 RepID=A0AAN7CJV1_9PEZI|nr:hypothetical protein C7999DRAFT_36281 [Corynascus novoguineensis]